MAQRTIPKTLPDPSVDQATLYADGIEEIRERSGGVWTDHNAHDPGVTMLEAVTYALTDVGYRAAFPVQDLLVSSTPAVPITDQFVTARTIFPNRPYTLLDYRKLLIDDPKVRNAWIEAAPETLYVDPAHGVLSRTPPSGPGARTVSIKGLYRALVDFQDDSDLSNEIATLRASLNENRNLCEDFVDVVPVPKQLFMVCADLELEPSADPVRVCAELEILVEDYFAPPVLNYTLGEMLERTNPQTNQKYTSDEIFEGPALEHGFIDDVDLEASVMRTEIRLSDVIRLAMGIEGVQAVRDMIVTPQGSSAPLGDKWVVPVDVGKIPALDTSPPERIVTHKRGIPTRPDAALVADMKAQLRLGRRQKMTGELAGSDADLPVPAGKPRSVRKYYSLQNHLPAVYGIGEMGLPANADTRRIALARQLKAYLLFFDQILADDFAQLERLNELFSTDDEVTATYHYQTVGSFSSWETTYSNKGHTMTGGQPDPVTDVQVGEVFEEVAKAVESMGADKNIERRNRFLDHLIARFGEQFHDYVAVTSTLGDSPESFIKPKCAFLEAYPSVGANRGGAYDASLTAPYLWDTTNVSGLERRVAKLLGLKDVDPGPVRADLGAGTIDREGMFVIENILLRTEGFGDPLLPICGDPTCTDCANDDPYSYRIHVILPAYAGRFAQMSFRRFTEEVIRQETPAHILPKICWVSRNDMRKIEIAYRAWLEEGAVAPPSDVASKLSELIEVLYAAKSVYPPGKLVSCSAGGGQQFIIGRTRLGTEQNE